MVDYLEIGKEKKFAIKLVSEDILKPLLKPFYVFSLFDDEDSCWLREQNHEGVTFEVVCTPDSGDLYLTNNGLMLRFGTPRQILNENISKALIFRTIGYFRTGKLAFHLSLAATTEGDVYLFVDPRRQKDGLSVGTNPLSCLRIDMDTNIYLCVELDMVLISLNRWHDSRKVLEWKKRIGQMSQFISYLGKRKESSSRTNVGVVDSIFVKTIVGESETRGKTSRKEGIYRSRLHNGLKKALPSMQRSANINVDQLLNSKDFRGFFQIAVKHHSLAHAAKRLPDIIDEMALPGIDREELRDRIIGAIADRLFSHCGWSMLEPEQIDSSTFCMSNAVVDIDQVSLQLTNFTRIIRTFQISNESLFTALAYFDKLLVSEIFGSEQFAEMLSLNYRKVRKTMQQVKGGHSYMKPSERKVYRSIICPTNGDVLKCSVACFRDSSHLRNKPKRYCKDEKFLEMEGFLRSSYFRDSEESWEKKSLDEKIILATYLTCQYLATADEHLPDETGVDNLTAHGLGFSSLFSAQTESTIPVKNGMKFPFLLPCCLSLLENDMGFGELNVVYETYGTKSRVSTCISGTNGLDVSQAATDLCEKNESLSTGHIWKFARWIKSRCPQGEIHLVLGFGCNFRIIDQDHKCQYAVVDTMSPPEIIRNEQGECLVPPSPFEYIDPTFEDQDQLFEDDSDIDNSELDGFEGTDLDDLIEHCPQSTASTILRDLKPVKYTVLGRTLPSSLQPSTHIANGFRYQQYSVNLRHALGECNQTVPLSLLASDISKCVVNAETGTFDVNFGMYYKRVTKFVDLVRENMKVLREKGNITRLEIGMTINPLDIEREICCGIRYCFNSCKKVSGYSAEDIATIAEFFAQALKFRAFIASELVRNKTISISPLDMNNYGVIPELNSYIRNFYTGRKSGGDGDIYGKKLGQRIHRPILKSLSENLPQTLRKVGIMCFDSLWNKFLENLNVTLLDSQRWIGPCVLVLPEVRRKVVCENCLRIFFADEWRKDCHPCFDEVMRGKKQSFLCPMNPIIVNKVAKLESQLTESQKTFLTESLHTEVGNQFNSHLTGVAGSGKSFTANVLIHKLLYLHQGMAKVAALCATKTGAGILYGSTIHSFFGLSTDDKDDFNLNDNFEEHFLSKFLRTYKNDEEWQRKVLNPVLSLEVMIIDECSLISACGLRNIDYLLRLLKTEKRPFGGVRMILIGDSLQMSPIFKGNKPPRRYYFQSTSFTDSEFYVYYLKDSLRQKDESFISLLNRVRIGDYTEEDLNEINTWGSRVPHDALAVVRTAEKNYYELDRVIHPSKYSATCPYRYRVLERFDNFDKDARVQSQNSFKVSDILVICAENDEMKQINSAYDDYIKANTSALSLTILAKDSYTDCYSRSFDLEERQRQEIDRMVERMTNLPTELFLYVGKIIKFTRNNLGPYIANNMLGEIVGIDPTLMQISVQPLCSNQSLIAPVISITPVEETCILKIDRLLPEVTVSRRQYPLRSATAVTLYTAEGITCDAKQNIIVCNHRFQHSGSAYTALSRAQFKEQILTLFPLQGEDVIVDTVAKEFDDYHHLSFKSKVLYEYDDTGKRQFRQSV